MLDTTHIATEIRHLIAAGTAERELLVRVARQFPDLTPAELSQALQVATTAAHPETFVSVRRERKSKRRACKRSTR